MAGLQQKGCEPQKNIWSSKIAKERQSGIKKVFPSFIHCGIDTVLLKNPPVREVGLFQNTRPTFFWKIEVANFLICAPFPCFCPFCTCVSDLLHFLLSFSWQTPRNHRDKQRIRELARQKKKEVKFVSNRKGTNQYDDGRFSLNSHKTSFIKNECSKSNAEF